MGKHHRDRDIMDEPRMRDPRMRDPNPVRNSVDPRNQRDISDKSNINNPVRNSSNGINFSELLKGIDINQVVSLVTTLAGVNNANISQLGSMIRNLDLSDLNKTPMTPGAASQNGISVNAMKAQLSILADQLDQMGKGNNASVQSELLRAIQTLQQSPELMNMFNNFVNANMPRTPNKD